MFSSKNYLDDNALSFKPRNKISEDYDCDKDRLNLDEVCHETCIKSEQVVERELFNEFIKNKKSEKIETNINKKDYSSDAVFKLYKTAVNSFLKAFVSILFLYKLHLIGMRVIFYF